MTIFSFKILAHGTLDVPIVYIKKRDPGTRLRETKVRFKPYSSDEYVPLLGCLDVKLTNEEGK